VAYRDDVRKRLIEKPRFELAVKGSDCEDVIHVSSGRAFVMDAQHGGSTVNVVAVV